MKLAQDSKLFIGFKAEGKLRQAYASVPHAGYVGEEGGGNFLTTFEDDGATYLGKVVAGGLSTESVDDVKRNVVSILRRLLPRERLPAALAIFAVAD